MKKNLDEVQKGRKHPVLPKSHQMCSHNTIIAAKTLDFPTTFLLIQTIITSIFTYMTCQFTPTFFALYRVKVI